MKKTVFILMLLTIISKILGFTRDISLSYFFGASVISDVYLISLTIPTVIFAIIGKGISTGFIPMYTHIENNDGIEKATYFTNNIVNAVIVLCTIIFIACMLFTEPIVNLFASGFAGESLELAINFTRISLIGIYFTGLIYVFSSFLQIKRMYFIPAVIGLPSNIIVIGSFFLSSHLSIYVLSVGNLIAIGSQLLLMSIFVYRSNYRYTFKLDLKNSHSRQMLLLAMPAILGSSVAQLNILIDRTLASQITEGGISALNYASTLNLFVLGIVASSIITVLFPKISKLAEENKIEEMKKSLSTAINTINLFVLPATVGYMLFAEPFVRLLFGRGEFDSQALYLTSQVLFFYSIGLCSLCLREILSNAFFSLHDTKTPMINATIAMIINIVLSLVLSKILGLGGLALATSTAAIIGTFLLFISLKKRLGDFGIKGIAFSFTKIVIASLIMGGLSKWAYIMLSSNFNLTLTLLLSITIGVVVYVIIICLMRIEEVTIVLFEIKKRREKMTKVRKVS